MSKSGVQNRNKMVLANPRILVAAALVKMPLAATTLAFLVSSAMCPEASNPVKVPAVNRLHHTSERSFHAQEERSYKDKIQFHPAGAPVPLSVLLHSANRFVHPKQSAYRS